MIVKKLKTGAEFSGGFFVLLSLNSIQIHLVMKKMIYAIVVLLILNTASAQVAAPTNATAVENIRLKEAEYDFGKIPQGKPVTHVFEVVNTGKDSLRINNVQASCGCTTPKWEQNKVYAPGETATITVGYNAASEGVFAKTITLTYNGTESKQLLIKGEVWKTPLSSAPENKDLGSLKEL
jgi:hypothetical protein